LKWDPSVLDHIFKEDEQWGEAPTLKSPFDEVGDYTERIILHHNTNFERQDGTTTEDIINQCIYATHMSTTTTENKGIIVYDTFQPDIAEATASTQSIISKTTVKRCLDSIKHSPDF
jgi:hypothetical protein